MAKKIKLTEETLNRLIKNILEQELDDDEILVSDGNTDEPSEVDLSDIEDELEQILSPEEILEYIDYLNKDLSNSAGVELRKSGQKLRALETRAGREIFWLKSRRL